MRRQNTDRLYVLEIPLGNTSLLLPSAKIAEVISIGRLAPVPYAPDWLLGVTGWRSLAVPVVSFEGFLGGHRMLPGPGAKIVVLYPLTGRNEWEFVSILSSAEPRPRSVEEAGLVTAQEADLPSSPYVAGGLRTPEGRLLIVPDLQALKTTFYPF
jgi:chemotaxis signal transduction protein